eukprot:PhM_4_TR6787/c0_g1_i1/m.96018
MLEILLTYLQFLNLIGNIPTDVAFPSWFRSAFVIFDVLNLNIAWLFKIIPSFDRAYEANFVIIVVMLPLIATFLVLIIFNSKGVVLWYFNVLIGAVLITCACIAMLLNVVSETSPFSTNTIMMFMIIGGGELFLMGSIYAFHSFQNSDKEMFSLHSREYRMKKINARFSSDDALASGESEMHRARQEFIETQNWRTTGERLAVVVFFFVVGVVLGGIFTPYEWNEDYVDPQYLEPIGYGCLLLSIVLTIWLLMGTNPRGRKSQWSISKFMRNNSMKAAMLALSIMYIPVVIEIVRVFMCTDVMCPAGSRLRDDASILPKGGVMTLSSSSSSSSSSSNSNTSATSPPTLRNVTLSEFCVPCNLASNITCGYDACPESSYWLLDAAPDLSCLQLRVFFWPASSLMILVFALGVPFLFYKLTTYGVSVLSQSYPIPNSQDLSEATVWSRQVDQSDCVSIFLFQSYRLKFRHWRMCVVVQKLLVVGSAVMSMGLFGLTHAEVALLVAAFVHTLLALVQIILMPYIFKIENLVAGLLQLTLATTACLGAMQEFNIVTIPSIVFTVLLIICFVLPLIALLIFIGLLVRYYRRYTRRFEGVGDGSNKYTPATRPGFTPPPPPPNVLAAIYGKCIEEIERETATMEDARGHLSVHRKEKQSLGEDAQSPDTQAPTVALRPVSSTESNSTTPILVSSPHKNDEQEKGNRNGNADGEKSSPLKRVSFKNEDDIRVVSVSDDEADEAATDQAASQVPTSSDENEPLPALFGMIEHKLEYNLTAIVEDGEEQTVLKEEVRKEIIESLEKLQDEVDHEINATSLSLIRTYFLTMGVLCCCALGMCMLGISSRQLVTRAPLDPAKSIDGYASFRNITSSCCCGIHTVGNATVEQWICPAREDDLAAVVFQRSRAVDSGAKTGYAVRQLCGAAFNPYCTVRDWPLSTVSVVCPLANTTNSSSSSFAGFTPSEVTLW